MRQSTRQKGEYTRRDAAHKTRVVGGAMVITHSVSAPKNGFEYGWYLWIKKLTFSFLSVQDDSVDIGTAKSGAAPP